MVKERFAVTVIGLLLFVQQIHENMSTLSITPLNLRLTEDVTTVDLTCMSDVPLSACQFTWLEQRYLIPDEGPLLDLSQGPQSRTNESYMDWDVTSYSYKGRGLEAGECGVTVQVEGYKDWVFGCRVKGNVGGWLYNWTTLFATESPLLPISTTKPREMHVRAGQVETMLCQAPGPITGCHFNKPGTFARVIFDQDYKSLDSILRHRYYGDGLGEGQCGIRLVNITIYESGPIQCVVDAPNAQGRMLSLLIVTSPPSVPVLQVVYQGSSLIATCTVNDSRPAAKLTWWLDDKIIRQDMVNDGQTGRDAPWQWPWEKHSITQTVTHKLNASEQKNIILCEVTHETMNQPLTAAIVIRIPVSSNITADTSTYPVGSDISIICAVDGYPVPSVAWFKDGQPLEPNERTQISESHRLLILGANSSDSGTYQCEAANQYQSSSSSISIDVQRVYIHPNCTDNPFFADCHIITQAHYCTHKYYKIFCCKSCTEDGQLPSYGPHLQRSGLPVGQFAVPVSSNITADTSTYPVGSDISILCAVDGYPVPSVAWFKDGQPLEPNERIQISESHRLLILGANSSDSGTYQCEAANQYQSSSSSISIDVQGVYIHPNCTDNPHFASCHLITQEHYCTHKYYARFCCKSCTEDGQLPSYGPHLQRIGSQPSSAQS